MHTLKQHQHASPASLCRLRFRGTRMFWSTGGGGCDATAAHELFAFHDFPRMDFLAFIRISLDCQSCCQCLRSVSVALILERGGGDRDDEARRGIIIRGLGGVTVRCRWC